MTLAHQERPVIIWLSFTCYLFEQGERIFPQIRPKCLYIIEEARLFYFRFREGVVPVVRLISFVGSVGAQCAEKLEHLDVSYLHGVCM